MRRVGATLVLFVVATGSVTHSVHGLYYLSMDDSQDQDGSTNRSASMDLLVQPQKRHSRLGEGKNARAGVAPRKFSPEEDDRLRSLVEQFGEKWLAVADGMLDRTARQCRERWRNYLSFNFGDRPWT